MIAKPGGVDGLPYPLSLAKFTDYVNHAFFVDGFVEKAMDVFVANLPHALLRSLRFLWCEKL